MKLIFTAKSPTPGEIFCKPPTTGVLINDTDLWIVSAHKEVYSAVEDEETYNFCNIYQNAVSRYLNDSDESGNSVECSAFEHRPIFYSIIHQYDLFCTREALVALTQSFHLLGVLIGGIIAFYMLKM